MRKALTIALTVTRARRAERQRLGLRRVAAARGEEEGRHRDQVVHRRAGIGRPLGQRAGDDRREEDDDHGAQDEAQDGDAQDHRRHGARVPESHRPLRLHQPAGAADPDSGDASGPEHRRSTWSPARPTRAMRSSRRCSRRSWRRRPGDEPGDDARRARDGHAGRRRPPRRGGRRRGGRPRVRLAAVRRRDLQHVQGRERDQPPQPRRARPRRRARDGSRGARTLRGAATGDRRLLRRPCAARRARSTRRGS